MVKKSESERKSTSKTIKERATKQTIKQSSSASKSSKQDKVQKMVSVNQQGYLTYDEINESLPDDLLSSDQLDETLMIFDDLDIEILNEGKSKPEVRSDRIKSGEIIKDESITPDFGTVTDPVKMYLGEMGLITLLS